MAPNNQRRKKNKKQRSTRKTNPVTNQANQPVNITIRNEDLLSNPLILEMVLIFCKGHHLHNKSFSTLRLVCKLWDIEVCKMTRPLTQIPLTRILSAYPEGLGWKWNRSGKSTGYQYQSPYPETTEFPNVKVTVTTCKVIEDPKVISWFTVMGGQVKSLHYFSGLNCYHQNRFLGNCLQTWCPNLETLNLSGIKCFASLIHIFEGEQQNKRMFESKGLSCKKLTSLIISVSCDEPVGHFAQCNLKTKHVLLSSRRQDISTVTTGLEDFTRLITNLPEKDPESGALIYQLIDNKMENLPNNFFEEVIIPKYFNPDGYFSHRSLDWGVIGLILRAAPLKKIIIKKLNGEQQCRDLTLFLLYQPSSLKSTLEHLEFQNNVFVGRDPTCLKNLSLFKFPLKYIRLDNLSPLWESIGYFRDLLESCATTLETLEVGMAKYEVRPGRVPPTFEVSVLPNLKKLVHRNISRLPLEGNMLLRNCPKLEICKIMDADNHLDQFKRRALDLFCGKLEEIAELGHPLKELEICGRLKVENVVQLGKGLGNLVKVNLDVGGANELELLLEILGNRWEEIEDFRVKIGEKEGDRAEKWKEMFGTHLSKIKSLKFLELDFEFRMVILLSVEAFRNGFAKLKGLTFLKINHFGILANDKKEIERSVEHIPFVCLSQMRIYSELRLFNSTSNKVVSLLTW